MLTRRVLRELTDSFLLGRPIRISCHCPRSSSAHPLPTARHLVSPLTRSSSSSTRWKARQGTDHYAREAKVQGLKSRAAFKLLEINQKYKLFKPGNTVIDLGYAPGSWSQVAINRTQPNGRVVGIDIIPAQPPKGVSTIQGNFLSPAIQAEVRAYVQEHDRGRPRNRATMSSSATEEDAVVTDEELIEIDRGYIDMERQAHVDAHDGGGGGGSATARADTTPRGSEKEKQMSLKDRDARAGRVVDVVLSDMMQNTSGIAFKDHAGSMDLCMAALTFCFDTLRTGGHFVCKFYQGAEDKDMEKRLKRLFEKVHREKPESSRSESKEAYFIGIRRKEASVRDEVLG